MPPPATFRVTESSLDTALRYATAIELLADRWRDDLEVLEVGAGSAGITQFLDHDVTGVDPAFERTRERATHRLRRVPGRADALPFDDGSFDVVLSLEMLEHVPPGEREASLREMLRVLRPGGRLVLSFPADATAAALDRWLNDAYKRKAGTDHPWAIEHLRNGVPATEEVVASLRELAGHGAHVFVQRHQSARSFRLVHGLYTARNFSKLTRLLGLHTRPVAQLLFARCRGSHDEPAYRSFVVVDTAG